MDFRLYSEKIALHCKTRMELVTLALDALNFTSFNRISIPKRRFDKLQMHPVPKTWAMEG